jgi:hypothetical protein
MRRNLRNIFTLLVLLALAILLHSHAKQLTLLVALHEILGALLSGVWEFISQPIVAAIIVTFLLLRFGIPSGSGLLAVLDELSATIGPLSVKGKIDASRLLTEPEPSGTPPATVRPQQMDRTTQGIVGNLDLKVTKFLVDVANRRLPKAELESLVSTIIWGEHRKDAASRAAAISWSAGILRSLRGTLLEFSMETPGDNLEIDVTISRPTLDLLYERLKQLGLETAPGEG